MPGSPGRAGVRSLSGSGDEPPAFDHVTVKARDVEAFFAPVLATLGLGSLFGAGASFSGVYAELALLEARLPVGLRVPPHSIGRTTYRGNECRLDRGRTCAAVASTAGALAAAVDAAQGRVARSRQCTAT